MNHEWQRGGFVDTIYGRVPGCRVCGVIPLTKAHVCEHGVTPAPRVEITISAEISDQALYDRLIAATGEQWP